MLRTLENLTATNRTFNRLPVTDFSGGLCLDGDSLGDNQSPDMLNIVVQRDGSICSRTQAIDPAHQNALPAKVCHIWQKQFYDQNATIMVSLANGELWEINCETFTASPTGIPAASNLDCKWRGVQATDVMYIYNGVDTPYGIYPDGSIVPLTQTWNDEVEGSDPPVVGYEQPCCGSMPIAKKMAFFQGHLWAADVTYPAGNQPLSDVMKGQPLAEDPGDGSGGIGVKDPAGLNTGVEERCNRIHFSFPIQGETGPEDWNSNDWVDLDEGQNGECITAMVECGNIMYVFKEHSIYAMQLGTSGEPQITKVSSKSGVKDCDQVICCDGLLFFFDIRTGVRLIGVDGLQPQPLSLKIWEDLRCLTDAELCEVRLGFCDGLLMLSVPALSRTFVLDTNHPTTPWTRYCWDLGSHFSFCPSNQQGFCVAASGRGNFLLKLNSQDFISAFVGGFFIFDDYGGGDIVVPETYYVTNWFGNPVSAINSPLSLKEWCDIDVVGYGANLNFQFRADFDPTNVVGGSDIVFADRDGGDPIVMDEFCFPEVKLVDPGCGRDPIVSCEPVDGPCFGVQELDRKYPLVKSKAVCPSLPNVSTCTLQLRIESTKVWCICVLNVSFREYPNAKERNQESTNE